jgi:hypothetical protein
MEFRWSLVDKMVTWWEEWKSVFEMWGVQDEADPKPVPSVASLLVTVRMKCFIFK